MTLLVHKKTGLPFAKGLDSCVDLPHTITAAVAHSAHMESLQELPKSKRPPRGIWDKPFRLEQFIEEAFSSKEDNKKKNSYTTISEEAE